MRSRIWLGLAVVVVLVSGCNRAARQVEVAAGSGSPAGLGTSMNVRVEGDTVRLSLHVTNVTSGPITLEFTSGQRYDFGISEPEGETVWRWSADKSFMQALASETLAAGESREYTETWVSGLRGSDYVATAWLTSANYPVELRTVFRPQEAGSP